MRKQDITLPRTPTDLMQRFQFDRTFAEIISAVEGAYSLVSETQQSVSEQSESLKVIGEKLGKKLGYNEKDKAVEMINGASEVVVLKNRLSIDSDHFKLSENGEINASKGNIGGFAILGNTSSNGFYGESMVNGSYVETNLTPTFVRVSCDSFAIQRTVSLEGGELSISLTSADEVMPSFGTFTINGKKYSLYINFDDNNRLCAYEWSDY